MKGRARQRLRMRNEWPRKYVDFSIVEGLLLSPSVSILKAIDSNQNRAFALLTPLFPDLFFSSPSSSPILLFPGSSIHFILSHPGQRNLVNRRFNIGRGSFAAPISSRVFLVTRHLRRGCANSLRGGKYYNFTNFTTLETLTVACKPASRSPVIPSVTQEGKPPPRDSKFRIPAEISTRSPAA